MGKIVVAGSYITDISVTVPRFGTEGETVIGQQVVYGAGGKGSNQATAAKRAGADVTLITMVGGDFLAQTAREHFKREGLRSTYLYVDKTQTTGIAIIEVQETTAQNRIIVAPNANEKLSAEKVQAAEAEFQDCDVVLVQLEASVESAAEAIRLGKKYGKTIIFNPAPWRPVEDSLLRDIDFITPNETELSSMTGMEVSDNRSAGKAAGVLLEKGVKNVIVTLGSRGALFKNSVWELVIPTVESLKPVDTTGAGDCFSGVLAVALSEQMKISKAIRFANCAASLAVTRKGASASMPTRREIDRLYLRTFEK